MQRPSCPPCHHGQSLNPVLAALRHTCLGLALAAPAILPALAHAQNPPQQSAKRVYDIPAGPLGTALSRFAGAAGVVLSFDAALTAGRESGGLHGSYGVDEGFARLLAGSGLEARAQGDGNYLLRPAPDAAAVLPAVAVSGKAIGAITEGTGLYTTYSSSSSTRLNLAPQETPQSLTVITRQQIEDLNATTLTALLDAVPGVHVVKEGVGDEIYGYYARGFEILNFEVDGVPTNNGLQLFSQNLAIYDRVEIVRGATGLISGMGNPAATINLIRKRPTLKPQASLSVEAGNWNRARRGLRPLGRTQRQRQRARPAGGRRQAQRQLAGPLQGEVGHALRHRRGRSGRRHAADRGLQLPAHGHRLPAALRPAGLLCRRRQDPPRALHECRAELVLQRSGSGERLRLRRAGVA
ncbi:TonB-dependent siderophore receptor [Thauera sp. SDU_THAU2]|uniref:TonB-dependent siderophore receptor n=1 Tax=Thauera sp. SDU_THAU2 TaxID=3136633 RepID=UPI00311E1A1F